MNVLSVFRGWVQVTCELQHKETNVPDFSHSRALNLYAAPLMQILILPRSGFASKMKGSLGSNTELLRSRDRVLCDAMSLGGLVQSVSTGVCSQCWSQEDKHLNRTGLSDLCYHSRGPNSWVILCFCLLSPNPSLKHNTVLIRPDNLQGET